MTKAEAITLLQSRVDLIKKDYPDIADYAEALEMAIEALHQFAGDSKKVSSSCGQENDPVSRKAAIDAFDTHADEIIIGGEENARNVLNYLNKVIDTIKGLPSAQPEQRWIPCSERLPEPRVDVWCNSDMGQMVGYYEEHVETWYGRDYLELTVTAWMPLPGPYTERREK